jgi:uncharacterized protein YdeI (YjbR/CyaY-like superfamily)
MSTKNPSVDAYIAKSAEFARPILMHIRKLVHTACPEVEEELKWGHPFFLYKGPLCMMPAFKRHCKFGFWGWKLVQAKIRETDKSANLNSLDKITSLSDLPPDHVLSNYVKAAISLKNAGVKAPAKPKANTKLVVPDCLKVALNKNKAGWDNFENFSYSHKKEYIEWINQAKQEATRNRRLAAAVKMIAQAKSRHWKYRKA